jgi:hypothetical protein
MGSSDQCKKLDELSTGFKSSLPLIATCLNYVAALNSNGENRSKTWITTVGSELQKQQNEFNIFFEGNGILTKENFEKEIRDIIEELKKTKDINSKNEKDQENLRIKTQNMMNRICDKIKDVVEKK